MKIDFCFVLVARWWS